MPIAPLPPNAAAGAAQKAMRCLLEYAESKGDRDAIFKTPATTGSVCKPVVFLRPSSACRARAGRESPGRRRRGICEPAADPGTATAAGRSCSPLPRPLPDRPSWAGRGAEPPWCAATSRAARPAPHSSSRTGGRAVACGAAARRGSRSLCMAVVLSVLRPGETDGGQGRAQVTRDSDSLFGAHPVFNRGRIDPPSRHPAS
jgi:hypothetical protein